MPRLAVKGPDLPPDLLEAHVEGRLVLFCGAGISRLRARHPDFKELVTAAFGEIGTLTDPAREAIRASEYDRALEILEAEVGPGLLRKTIVDLLDAPPVSDLTVHEMLLDLATTRAGQCRLVTTNFDDLFSRAKPDLLCDVAPKLPVPKPHKWIGLVHLHGSIKDPVPDGINLILTRADFGSAYLLERWASRFVAELFRNFSVLFIGYGVDDPVLRYLVDAIAAERGRTSGFGKAYALAGVQGPARKVAREKAKWKSRGLEPLFFHSGWRFKYLYESLRNWRDLYAGGLQSRSYFVLRSADRPPPTADDDDAKLVVWGLSEPSGAVARAFASRDPLPPLEWLQIFEDSDHLQNGRKLLSMPRRSPGQTGPEASLGVPLADRGQYRANSELLSPVTEELGRWLSGHLANPELLRWVISRRYHLHPRFRSQLRRMAREHPDISPALRRLWTVIASEALAALDSTPALVADDF